MSGFCSGVCNEISRCCYDFYHAPFTKKNLLIGGGILLGIIVLIIIIVVASKHGHDGPSSGSEIIKLYPLVDGANSLSNNIKKHLMDQINERMGNNALSQNLTTFWKQINCTTCQTDLFRLKKGFVSTQVFSVTTYCDAQYKDAVSQTLEQIDLMKRIIADPLNKMELITQSEEITKMFHKNTTGAILNVWGGHNIDSRLAVLRMYYDLGVRMMALVAWDESSGQPCLPPWIDANGLNDFGKLVIEEMNRMGMIIDLTGCTGLVQKSVLNITKAPIIFSHSGSYTENENPLNVDDAILHDYGHSTNLGLVMVPFSPKQLSNNSTSTLANVKDHLQSLMKLLPSTKIGIGSNFDNMTSVSTGLEDVSKFPDLFNFLWKKSSGWQGYLKGWAGDNFISVFKAVEKASSKAKSDDAIIKKNDLNHTSCYSDFDIRYNTSMPTSTPKPNATIPTKSAPTK